MLIFASLRGGANVLERERMRLVHGRAAWPRPTDHDRVWWVHRPTNMAPEERSRREMALVMARRSSALLLLLLAVFWCWWRRRVSCLTFGAKKTTLISQSPEEDAAGRDGYHRTPVYSIIHPTVLSVSVALPYRACLLSSRDLCVERRTKRTVWSWFYHVMHMFYTCSSSLSASSSCSSIAIDVLTSAGAFSSFLPRRHHIQCTMMLTVELCALLEEN